MESILTITTHRERRRKRLHANGAPTWSKHRRVTGRASRGLPKVLKKSLPSILQGTTSLWVDLRFFDGGLKFPLLVTRKVSSMGEWKITLIVISIFILSDIIRHLEEIFKNKRGLNLRDIQYSDQGFFCAYCKSYVHLLSPFIFSVPLPIH